MTGLLNRLANDGPMTNVESWTFVTVLVLAVIGAIAVGFMLRAAATSLRSSYRRRAWRRHMATRQRPVQLPADHRVHRAEVRR